MTANFENLPNDMKNEIFSHLLIKDQLSLAATSKKNLALFCKGSTYQLFKTFKENTLNLKDIEQKYNFMTKPRSPLSISLQMLISLVNEEILTRAWAVLGVVTFLKFAESFFSSTFVNSSIVDSPLKIAGLSISVLLFQKMANQFLLFSDNEKANQIDDLKEKIQEVKKQLSVTAYEKKFEAAKFN